MPSDQNHLEQESFRDSIATIDKDGKRAWIFPTKPSGKLYNLRAYLSYVYLVVFFGLPFIKFNGEPLFMINVLERKFILFGMIFWPQDFFIFGLGMLIFIVFIALFTVIFGRVFCGWACPQTIFMEMLFRRIEYWIEGDANYQRQLKNAPWNNEKILKKSAKWVLFFALSFLIANTLLSYLISVDDVLHFYTDPAQHKGGIVSLLSLHQCILLCVFLVPRTGVFNCLPLWPYARGVARQRKHCGSVRLCAWRTPSQIHQKNRSHKGRLHRLWSLC
jgi:hypothetical protein